MEVLHAPEYRKIVPPSHGESLRVVLLTGEQIWNVMEVRVSERWVTFRAGGTRFDVPVTSVVAIATHSRASGTRKPGTHDGQHGPECLVCFPVAQERHAGAQSAAQPSPRVAATQSHSGEADGPALSVLSADQP